MIFKNEIDYKGIMKEKEDKLKEERRKKWREENSKLMRDFEYQS